MNGNNARHFQIIKHYSVNRKSDSFKIPQNKQLMPHVRRVGQRLVYGYKGFVRTSYLQIKFNPSRFLHLLNITSGGYRGNIIKEIKTSFNYVIQVVMRSDNRKKEFKPIPKRWIIERTFSWVDNDRRLYRNYELLMESAENMVKLSAIKLLLKKIQTGY